MIYDMETGWHGVTDCWVGKPLDTPDLPWTRLSLMILVTESNTCDAGIGSSPSVLVTMSFITWYILFGLTLLSKYRVSKLKGTKRLGFGFRHVTIV